jgi:TrkA domain protein
VVLRDGRRDLLLYDNDDPDSCSNVVELEPAESAAMVELLGGSKVTERLADLRYEVEGLSIEWVTMSATSSLTGKTIGDGAIRTRTGASVVAVIRGETSFPGPGPDFRFEADDVVLVMGSVEGVHMAAQLLAS